ncbi:MAG: hypothetical protein ACOCRK_00615 [bacterium]
MNWINDIEKEEYNHIDIPNYDGAIKKKSSTKKPTSVKEKKKSNTKKAPAKSVASHIKNKQSSSKSFKIALKEKCNLKSVNDDINLKVYCEVEYANDKSLDNFFKKGADPNYTFIMELSKKNKIPFYNLITRATVKLKKKNLESIIKAGGDINKLDTFSNSYPIILLLKQFNMEKSFGSVNPQRTKKYKEIFDILIKNGAELVLKDPSGKDAKMWGKIIKKFQDVEYFATKIEKALKY